MEPFYVAEKQRETKRKLATQCYTEAGCVISAGGVAFSGPGCLTRDVVDELTLKLTLSVHATHLSSLCPAIEPLVFIWCLVT